MKVDCPSMAISKNYDCRCDSFFLALLKDSGVIFKYDAMSFKGNSLINKGLCLIKHLYLSIGVVNKLNSALMFEVAKTEANCKNCWD